MNPGEAFMAQIARNLTDAIDGFLNRHRFLILDRDSKFSPQFKRVVVCNFVRRGGSILGIHE